MDEVSEGEAGGSWRTLKFDKGPSARVAPAESARRNGLSKEFHAGSRAGSWSRIMLSLLASPLSCRLLRSTLTKQNDASGAGPLERQKIPASKDGEKGGGRRAGVLHRRENGLPAGVRAGACVCVHGGWLGTTVNAN